MSAPGDKEVPPGVSSSGRRERNAQELEQIFTNFTSNPAPFMKKKSNSIPIPSQLRSDEFGGGGGNSSGYASSSFAMHHHHHHHQGYLASPAGSRKNSLSSSPMSSPRTTNLGEFHGGGGSHRLASSSLAKTNDVYITHGDSEGSEDAGIGEMTSEDPPPIVFTEQVSHVRANTMRSRPTKSNLQPLNTTGKKRILKSLRERRQMMERSSAALAVGVTSNATGSTLKVDSPVATLTSYDSFNGNDVDEVKTALSGTFLSEEDKLRQNFVRLERGGVVVETSCGPIQFGIPPETLKDSLSLGFEVPQIFIVPRDRFDAAMGLNMCEVEFPGYYQFFLRQRSVTLVASKEAETSIRLLMHETLRGPDPNHLYTTEECTANPYARPDHEKEMEYFVRPRNGRTIEVDTMFSFIRFEKQTHVPDPYLLPSPANGASSQHILNHIVAIAKINDAIEIRETNREWIVIDQGKEIARIEFWLASMVPPQFPLALVLPTKTFVPPKCGVTVLGSSHGFDPKQSTSGFVFWMFGRGIMVDPPPNATDLLKRGGISPRLVSAIILTHCHADHDAGTFQKILVEGRITLMTTKTIMASFLRKYSMISGFTEAFLLRLFEPRIVKIDEDVFFGGGTLRFFYSLHALPCIGFRATVAGKTFAYSADTFYHPETLEQLCKEGVLSEARKDSLLAFPFETTDLVLHEAGIPPIHTPLETLQALSTNAKRRLYLIHIAESAAANSGLKLAKAGTDYTIRVGNHGCHSKSDLPAEGNGRDDDDNEEDDEEPSQSLLLDVLIKSELFFPYTNTATKSGRGIVLAAQERMQYIDYNKPRSTDFSYLDEAIWAAKFYATASGSGQNSSRLGVDRGTFSVRQNSMDSIHLRGVPERDFRDSDLSYSSLKRNSTGLDSPAGRDSPMRVQISSGSIIQPASSPAPNFGDADAIGFQSSSRRLSIISSSRMFLDADEEDFTVVQVCDLLKMSSIIHRGADEIVSADEGQGDTHLYLIVKGFCRVERFKGDSDDEPLLNLHEDEFDVQPSEGPPGTILEPGDCFGLLTVDEFNRGVSLRRVSRVRSLTSVQLMVLDTSALWYMLNVYPMLDRRLSRMHELRALEAWKTMELNSCLKRLASIQRTQLNAVLEPKVFKSGEELWSRRPGPRHAYLVAEGELVFSELADEMDERPFCAGAFLCDFHSMIGNRKTSNASSTAAAASPSFHEDSSGSSSFTAATPILHASSVLGTSAMLNSGPSLLMAANDSNVYPQLTLKAKSDCRLYQINWRDALAFLEANPGVLVQIYHSLVVE